MSKKRNKDIWDLTPEEQMKGADDFYEFEKGNLGIMDIANVGKRLSENGLTGDLEKKVISDLSGMKFDEPGKEVQAINLDDIIASKFGNDEHEEESVSVNVTEDVSNEPDEEVVTYSLRSISADVTEELNRLSIDDGIAPASISLDVAALEDLVGTYDAEDIAEKIENLLLYIISLKHPTAIYSDDEFSSKKYNFDDIVTYNKNKFKFFTVNNTYFCYVIEDESIDKLHELFHNYMTANNGTPDDILRYFINLAYSCGSRNNAFFIEDVEYVNKFYHSEELNDKDAFYNALIYDDDTETGNTSDENCLDIYDVKNLQTVVRGTIASMTGQSYFGDEDEDDDDVYDDELDEEDDAAPDQEVDVKDLSKKLDDDIASDLMGDEMEPVEEQKPEKSDEYTVPVIRKK